MAIDSAVMTVENLMHDAILRALDNVVTLRVEMAVTSITNFSGHGPNRVVQNLYRRDFNRIPETLRAFSASSHLDFNLDQVGIDETRDIEKFEDGDFLALRRNYDRRAQTHHKLATWLMRKMQMRFLIVEKHCWNKKKPSGPPVKPKNENSALQFQSIWSSPSLKPFNFVNYLENVVWNWCVTSSKVVISTKKKNWTKQLYWWIGVKTLYPKW